MKAVIMSIYLLTDALGNLITLAVTAILKGVFTSQVQLYIHLYIYIYIYILHPISYVSL